jgi:VIT1/CCC1 family predicted Fe2+/Mn2+ transporter
MTITDLDIKGEQDIFPPESIFQPEPQSFIHPRLPLLPFNISHNYSRIPVVESSYIGPTPQSKSHQLGNGWTIDIDEHEHLSHRRQWVRAFVLGAMDGLVSVGATMTGVTGGSSSLSLMRITGISAWIAGALAMAAGEYVSVSSQRDCEEADIQKERDMQALGPEARQHELEELALIWERRGLDKDLAMTVAEELTAHDVIRAHAKDELGIDMDDLQDPIRAAYVSALACTVGASIPLLAGAFIKQDVIRAPVVFCATAAGCFLFGSCASALGGAGILKGGVRVAIGGILAMGITFGISKAFGIYELGIDVDDI